jgi:hypothetical protein
MTEELAFDSLQEERIFSIASWRPLEFIQPLILHVMRMRRASASGLKLLELEANHSPPSSVVFLHFHLRDAQIQAQAPYLNLSAI